MIVSKFLFIGRPVEEKGLHVLIEALCQIDKPDIILTLVGDHHPNSAHVKIAKQNNLNTNFKGVIEQDSLRSIIRLQDVVVVPSLYENFGFVSLEAMACGIPVVASNTGGLGEIVQKGGGKVFEPGNPESLKEVLLSIDNSCYTKMKQTACAFAREFDWEIIMKDYIELFSTLESKISETKSPN